MAKPRPSRFTVAQFMRRREAVEDWAIVSAANAGRARALHGPRTLVVPGAPAPIWEVIEAGDDPALDEEVARSKHAQMTRMWPG